VLQDVVRGFGSTTLLCSNATAEENRLTDPTDGAERGYISTATSSGFSIVNGTGTPQVNGSAVTYVAWTWDAGSSTVTDPNGSIESQVRANASAGFSVVTWTGGGSGYSVGHGLGVAPKLIIIKDRNNAFDWIVFTTVIDGSLDYLYLNLTDAKADSGGSLPTSTLVYPGQSTSSNYVMYCFAPVAGYSAMGSYTGNGSSTDGPFVYTGFKPRFILIKGSSVANTDWAIIDTARDTYNIATDYLAANSSGAEQTLNLLDVVSNGFKIKAYTDSTNQNGQTFVWAAFASHPFAYARAR
jgi:hypothetical protein